MRCCDLLQGFSGAYIMIGESKGYAIKVKIGRLKSINWHDTYHASIRVFAKGEKWGECYWFNCTDTIDEVIEAVQLKFKHIKFKKEVKTINYKAPRKKKVAKKPYYIKKINPDVGCTTTRATTKPLFEFI